MRFGTHPFTDWLPLLETQSGAVRCVFCSTLVITVTWLAAVIAARRSAAIRHRIFFLGVAGLLVVPGAIAITAGWNPIIFLSGASKPVIAINSDVPAVSSQHIADPEPIPNDARAQMPVAFEPFSQLHSVEPSDLQPVQLQRNDSVAATSDAAVVVHSATPVAGWRPAFPQPQNLLGALWTAGVLLLGIRLAREWFLIRRIVRNAVPITDEQTISLLIESRQSIERLANRRSRQDRVAPMIFCSASTPVPIAVGILQPKIVLPVGFGKWTNERLQTVLMHELTHIDRRDVLAHALARLACMFYWFNPLVWLATRRMCLERELACDDFLLCSGENPEGYVNTLFEIATAIKQSRRTALLATPMATQSHLKIRVQHLMQSNLDRRFVSTRASLLAAVAAVITVLTLAAISPSFGIAQTKPAKKIADLNDAAVTLSGEIPSDWFDQLSAMPNLQKLTIRSPDLANLKVARLRELKNLTAFSAEDFSIDSRLADLVAVNVAQLPGLKSVEFHRTGLTGRGLQALSQSPTAELILEGEELSTDADFKHVAKMPQLRSLVLDTTPVDADGLKALQAAPGLRRVVLRRHPSGSDHNGTQSRVKAIAGFKKLEELELGDTGYGDLVALKATKSLRILTLRHCGAKDTSKSLKQLSQLNRIEVDGCDIRDESFDDVKSTLKESGIVLVDVTTSAGNLLTGSSAPLDEATELARHALDELNIGKHFPAFWIGWKHHWNKIPSMTAQPVRTVHRLKQALTAESEKQPWGQDTEFAYAPGQFFLRNRGTTNDVSTSMQMTFGDAKLARSRQGQPDQPATHVLRNGVREFEESMGPHFPRQLSITHQQMWWGIPTHHSITTSSVSPQKVNYMELPEESFAGETCRVFQAPGRSERLWVSKTTGRLRGTLHYIHQGYFTPFYKQEVVTQIAGRRILSQEDYSKLFSGPRALADDARHQLDQAWAEYEFNHAYPGQLYVLDDYREIAAGRWFPFKVSESGWLHNQKDQGKYDFHSSESVVTEVVIDRNDLEPYWAEFLPKAGERVQDQRYGVAVDYPFDNDRTEDEIQTLVNDRLLEFARTKNEIDLVKRPFAKLLGKPAPSLPKEGWVGERPELAGQRYLIHFWAVWCGPCKNDIPLLNSIAKDRIVIGIHPGDTSIERVSEVVKESKMAYPTVVAPEDAQDLLGYPAKMFPYCVEVDEQGNVAKHGFLEEILGLKGRQNAVADQPVKAAGSILAIDAKNGLAVISFGESDGIQDKQLLDVVREGKSIAQLRVITLYKNRCVGKITDEIEPANMKTGDKVLSFTTTPNP